MAQGKTRALSDMRVFSIAFLWLAVLFLIPFGLAMGRPAIAALAGAGGVFGSATIVITAARRGERQWIRGWAEVIACSESPAHGTSEARCELELMVEVPRRDRRDDKENYSAIVSDLRVPVEKWPYEGQRLPVRVATNDRNKIEVLWRKVHTEHDLAVVNALVEEYEHTTVNPTETRVPRRRHPEADRPGRVETRVDTVVAEPDAIVSPSGTLAVLNPPSGLYPPDTDDPRFWSITPVSESYGEAAVNAALLDAYRRNAPPGQPGGPGAEYGRTVTLATTDLSRAVAFYREKFGFEVADVTLRIAKLELGRVYLNLRADRVPPIEWRVLYLHLAADGLTEVYTQLQDEGVEFDHAPRVVGRARDLELLAVTCRDLEGHGIALTQWARAAS